MTDLTTGDLTTLGIAEAGRLMARGDLTSMALTEAFLTRIAAVDRSLSSYVLVTADIASGTTLFRA